MVGRRCRVRDAWARSSSEAIQGGTLIIGRHLFILPLYNSVNPPPRPYAQRKPVLSSAWTGRVKHQSSSSLRVAFNFISIWTHLRRPKQRATERVLHKSVLLSANTSLHAATDVHVRVQTAGHPHVKRCNNSTFVCVIFGDVLFTNLHSSTLYSWYSCVIICTLSCSLSVHKNYLEKRLFYNFLHSVFSLFSVVTLLFIFCIVLEEFWFILSFSSML